MMVVFGSKITRFLASFSHSNIFIFLKKKTVTNHERHLANSQMHRIIFFAAHFHSTSFVPCTLSFFNWIHFSMLRYFWYAIFHRQKVKKEGSVLSLMNKNGDLSTPMTAHIRLDMTTKHDLPCYCILRNAHYSIASMVECVFNQGSEVKIRIMMMIIITIVERILEASAMKWNELHNLTQFYVPKRPRRIV